MRKWIMEVFASPSGRASSRRHTWVWTVIGALIVSVWQGLTGGDVKSGTLALFTALLTATGAAVTAGRFAERGSEAPRDANAEVEERRRA